jgi:hypothetical protein
MKAGNLLEGSAGRLSCFLAGCLEIDIVPLSIGFDGAYVVIEQGGYLEPLWLVEERYDGFAAPAVVIFHLGRAGLWKTKVTLDGGDQILCLIAN